MDGRDTIVLRPPTERTTSERRNCTVGSRRCSGWRRKPLIGIQSTQVWRLSPDSLSLSGSRSWSRRERKPIRWNNLCPSSVESKANRAPGLHAPIMLDSSRESVRLCVEFSTNAVLSDAIGSAGGGIHRTSEHHPICRMRLVAIRRRIDCDRTRWVR